MNALLGLLIRAVSWGFNALPISLRLGIAGVIVKLAALIIPRIKRVSLRNLEIAFPEKSLAERQEIYQQSLKSLARFGVDMLRSGAIDQAWVKKHVDISGIPTAEELRARAGSRGILYLTGHYGSFELLSSILGLTNHRYVTIFRTINNQAFGKWIADNRAATGHTVLNRDGALKEVLRQLKDGNCVAMLFDQNVTVNHAIFVPWFTKLAATTGGVALSAMRSEALIFLTILRYIGGERYRLEGKLFEFDELYRDPSISKEEKLFRITDTVSQQMVQYIREVPDHWWWVHRRWKTRPEGEPDRYKA